jgi:hypothetical protein
MRAPLVPNKFAELYISMAQLSVPVDRLQSIKRSLSLLPRANYIMLERLACLFHLVANAGTGPTAEELAAIFALVLIWPPTPPDAGDKETDDNAKKAGAAHGSDLLLTVSIPSLQMSSKIHLSPQISAHEALQLIFKKVRRLDSDLPYRIWLPPPKNICCEPDAVLQQFNLRSGDTLIVKQSGKPVPPDYQAAAADLWLVAIEEYRFLFANGAPRFLAEVHRVPIARNTIDLRHAIGGGFRRRAVISADMLASELDSALRQAEDGGGGGGGGMPAALSRDRSSRAPSHMSNLLNSAGAGSPVVPRANVGATQPPGRSSGIDADSDSFYPMTSVSTAASRGGGVDDNEFKELKLAFGLLEDDVLREALVQCGTLRSATEFLQGHSDEAEAQRDLYSTLEIKDIKHRPAPALPKGATPHSGALNLSSAPQLESAPVGSLSGSAFSVPSSSHADVLSSSHSAGVIPVMPSTTSTSMRRQRPELPQKPGFLTKTTSLPAVEAPMRALSPPLQRTESQHVAEPRRALSPGPPATARAAAPLPPPSQQQQLPPQRPELGLNASKPDLFKEIAFLNSEVRRMTQLNRELVAATDDTAAIRSLRAQVDDLTAHLEEIKERCTCGAARYRSVK